MGGNQAMTDEETLKAIRKRFNPYSSYQFPTDITTLLAMVERLTADFRKQCEVGVAICEQLETCQKDCAVLRTEAKWIRDKLNLPEDCKFLGTPPSVAGEMHVICSQSYGYQTYIEAGKCSDKEGKIATLTKERDEAREVARQFLPVEKREDIINVQNHELWRQRWPWLHDDFGTPPDLR